MEELTKLLQELQRIQEAYNLLWEVKTYLDPYSGKINGENDHGISRKIHDFFGFDDSE